MDSGDNGDNPEFEVSYSQTEPIERVVIEKCRNTTTFTSTLPPDITGQHPPLKILFSRWFGDIQIQTAPLVSDSAGRYLGYLRL